VAATSGLGGDFFRQTSKLVSKTATTLTIDPGPYIDLTAKPVKIVGGMYPGQKGVGVEDLTLDMANTNSFDGIELTEVCDSWLLRVKITNTWNYGVYFYACTNLEIRGCYIGPSKQPPGTNQAGILFNTVCASLIEDNIVIQEYPSVEINTGSSGNVWAYNLFYFTVGSYYAIDSNHGPHNVCNLYEGNVITNFLSDGYFGSESDGTIFRTWITGKGSGASPNSIGWTVALKRLTRDYSIVGNVLGLSGFSYSGPDTLSLGQPNIGNGDYTLPPAPPWSDWLTRNGPSSMQQLDSGVQGTLVRKGNYNYSNSTLESLGGDALPASLFRTSKPAWFGNLAWPPIDPATAGTKSEADVMKLIPAGLRYVTGTGPTPTPTPGPTATPAPTATPTPPPQPTPTPTPVPTPTPQPTPTPPPSGGGAHTHDANDIIGLRELLQSPSLMAKPTPTPTPTPAPVLPSGAHRHSASDIDGLR
jgi:hypothetical protein